MASRLLPMRDLGVRMKQAATGDRVIARHETSELLALLGREEFVACGRLAEIRWVRGRQPAPWMASRAISVT